MPIAEVTSVDSPSAVPAPPTAANWLVPSVADLIFAVLLLALCFGLLSQGLLNDADTGWHIRNGETILHTHAVPHADYFSYTMAGQPWYAWEWLYDVAAGALYARMGLNGIVLLSALLIAATFGLLFHLTLRRSGNLLAALVVTLLALAAASIHFLARPHLVTLLLTVVWLWLLERLHTRRPTLVAMPVLMLFWVNVHGGFLVALALLALSLVAESWTWIASADHIEAVRARAASSRTALAFALCALSTFANPYGYRLHAHVYGYLTSRYLMDHISEFQPPNFHAGAPRAFAFLLLLTIVAFAARRNGVKVRDLLTSLFAIYIGLYAARNLPIAAVVLAWFTAPLLGQVMLGGASSAQLAGGIRRLLASATDFGERMATTELALRGHIAPLALTAMLLWAGWHGGRLGSAHILRAGFDPTRFPVAATRFIAQQDIRDHLFTTDDWGPYLIYRLHPQLRVFIDDRHDFYGEQYLKDYMKIVNVSLGWDIMLERHAVHWVLLRPDSALANTLKQTATWSVAYDDGMAILFRRR